ncbi:MAG: trehalase family glycosidase, partial [Nitrososphaerota archaeon]
MSERRQSIEKALKVLRSNVLPLNSYKAVVPHPSYYPWVYCWDTALHVMALSYVDAELAKENVDALLSFQRADGMIPNAPTSKDDQDMRSQPPLIVHAVRRYVEVTGDYQSARRWFEGLLKYHMWWRRVGVHPEAPHALASPFTGTRVETDLTAYWAVCSTGMDNHAVYDKTEGRLLLHNNYYYLPMEDLLINSMLAESARSLVTIAEWVGRMDEVDAMSEEYRIISRKVEQFMWDEESGFYYPCSFKEKRIAVKSCQTFAPLLAGISSHDR